MGKLSRVLRNVEGGGVVFYCPGCKQRHCVWIGAGNGPRWTFNFNVDAPTFSPSVLIRTGHYCDGQPQPPHCDTCNDCAVDGEPTMCKICHSFVRDGRIEFLSDCTHALAGQTVDLPDMPE